MTAAPRLGPVERPDAEQRELLGKTLPTPDGEPLNVFATLAHRPRLLRRFNALGGYFFVDSLIGARERELVILRVAARARCNYEAAQHLPLAGEAGLSVTECKAALDPQPPQPWSSSDAAVLAIVDELLLTGAVNEAAWAELARLWSPEHGLELLVLVGFYRMLAGVLDGIGARIDAHAEPYDPGWLMTTDGEGHG